MRDFHKRVLATFVITLSALPILIYVAFIPGQASEGHGSARALYALLLLLIPLVLLATRLRKSSYALVPVSLCVGALMVEAGAMLIVKSPLYQRNLYRYKTAPPYITLDPEIGFVLTPDTSPTESKFFLDGETIFRNVRYDIDGKGRRVTSASDAAQGGTQSHALFFGCSFTFGMGVPEAATYPAQFQQLSGGACRVLNYGAGGYGTSQMYLQLQRDALFDDVNPKEGIAVYTFIDDQLHRTVPFLLHRTIAFTSRNKYFIPADDGIQGPFSAQEIPDAWNALQRFKFMNEFSAAWLLGAPALGFHYYPSDAVYEVVGELIVRSQRLYKERFDGTFIVVVWPRCVLDCAPLHRMITRMEESGILVLRPPELPPPAEVQIHPRDFHPSAAEYAWVAKHIYEEVEARELLRSAGSPRARG